MKRGATSEVQDEAQGESKCERDEEKKRHIRAKRQIYFFLAASSFWYAASISF